MTATNDETAWLRGIGKRVKVARVWADQTQQQLADRAGLTRNKVSAIERAGQMVRVFELARVARATGIPLADLLDGAP